MQVWLNGQFIEVNVLDAQGGYGGYAYPVQGVGRQEMVQVAMDVVQRAQQFGHERDVHVLIGRNAAAAFLQPGVPIQPVHAAELQNLWTLAAQGQFEKTAARALYLLLAARHRQKALDVLSIAASLQRSAWEVMSALRLLHDYGAIGFGAGAHAGGQVPDPADTSVQAARNGVRLASDPPDVARLTQFADGLARVPDVLAQR